MKEFEKILRMTQSELKAFLKGYLADYGYDVIDEDGFLYAEGTLPVLLVAHMDRHPRQDESVKNIYKTHITDDGNVVFVPVDCEGGRDCHSLDWYGSLLNERHSDINGIINKFNKRTCCCNIDDVLDKIKEKAIQEKKAVWVSPEGICGDDRCGVWTIMQLLKNGHHPSVLFTEYEEVSCKEDHGSVKFCNSEYINKLDVCYMVQIDRRNANDLKFYQCGNADFKEWIVGKTGYKPVDNEGGKTDIYYLMPKCNIAGVNFSCGYYCEHIWCEYVAIEEMVHTKDTIDKLLKETGDTVYHAMCQ